MAAKKRRRKKPGLLWRVLFGYNGPTERRLRQSMDELRAHIRRQLRREEFVLAVRDPATGVVHKKRMRLDEGGRLQEVKVPSKKRPAAKKKPTSRRGASQPSKPSRASKSGSASRRGATATAAQPRTRRKAEPLADRVLRNPDGTLAGSRPADPAKQLRKAEQAYLKASKRAEQLLGWEQAPRQR